MWGKNTDGNARLQRKKPKNKNENLRSHTFRASWAEMYGKRDLCHESKLTVLSMRGGYLATELARDTSCCVGSLNNSGNTVKECTGHRGLKSQSANISWGMRFEECRLRLWTNDRGLFSHTALRTQKKRELC